VFIFQRTWAERVRDKYELFVHEIPDFETLAGCDLRSVLRIWHGLGYKQRPIALKGIIIRVIKEYAESCRTLLLN
jgi:adenine-specific DNA glycosylase